MVLVVAGLFTPKSVNLKVSPATPPFGKASVSMASCPNLTVTKEVTFTFGLAFAKYAPFTT